MHSEFSSATEAAEVAEVAYIAGERCTPRLKMTPVPPGTQKLEAEGSHMISGGFGGLGLSIAQELVDMGAGSLLLVSRSGRVANDDKLQQMFSELQASSATVHAWSCDVADAAKTRELLKKAKALDVPLRSVVHAAGIIDFCEVASLTSESMSAVFKPKVLGAWNLHSELGTSEDLAAFVLFSSVSSLVGLPGPQLDAAGSGQRPSSSRVVNPRPLRSSGITYSTSNAYLDGLSLWRRAAGSAATSLQWLGGNLRPTGGT